MSFVQKLQDDSTASASVEEILVEMGVELPESRPEHYQMAHVALRMFALENPIPCITICASDKAQELVGRLFESVTDTCESQESPGFEAKDFRAFSGRIGSYPTVIFACPPPVACPEAYLTAIVVLVEPGELTEEMVEQGVPARYFTLERGIADDDGNPRTVFCEWTKESHLNMGDGPKPSAKEFAAKIESVLEAS